MNRKKRGLTLAALLGIWLFALTCGAALAKEYPVFYAKIANQTDNAIKIEWNFSQRDGGNAGESHRTTIKPHETHRFWGDKGQGRMNVWMHTGGEGGVKKKFTFNGDENPQAPNALYNIGYNKDGHLRLYDPKK